MKGFSEKLTVKSIGLERLVLGEGLGERERAIRIKISIVLGILGHYQCLNSNKM